MWLFILALLFLIIGYGLLRISRFMGNMQKANKLAQEQEEYEYQKSLEVEARLSRESELGKLLRANRARQEKRAQDTMLEELLKG